MRRRRVNQSGTAEKVGITPRTDKIRSQTETALQKSARAPMKEVYCWCQSEIVLATQDEIWAGKTRSCGAPDCKEPE